MKYLMLIVLMYTFLMPLNAQKVVKSTDFKLSEFEKINSPAQLIGLKLTDEGKIVVYSLKQIWGLLKTQKGTYKSGMPYFSQQTFDFNFQKTGTEGALMMPWADTSRKYSFEPSMLSNDLTKEMEIKSNIPDLNKTIGLQTTNKVFESTDIISTFDAATKKNVVYLSTISNTYAIDNQGLVLKNYIKTVDVSPYAVVEENLAYEPTTKTLLLSPTVAQKVVYEVKKGENWSAYMNFRLITMTDKGVLLNDENMNLPNIKKLQDFLPVYNEDAEVKGSLIVFEKQSALGNKSKKDPIKGNRSIFVGDENGKLWSKFDHQHANGEGFFPFSAYVALIKNDKLYVLNINLSSIMGSKQFLETVVFDKMGKAEVTSSIPLKDLKPKKIGTTNPFFISEVYYSNMVKGENGALFLIGQNFKTETTTTITSSKYGDIFIVELDADFKYKGYTIVALPASGEKAKIDIMEQKAGKAIINVTHKSGSDVLILIEGSKVNALSGFMPDDSVPTILSEWSKSYLYDAKNKVIHYFYQSKTETNKGKVVTVSLLP
jgi:hypothetical protein